MDINWARLLRVTDELKHCASGHGDELHSSIAPRV
jgi:hypothetical protein